MLCTKVAGAFVDKIEEWIKRSNGRIRAAVLHDKLVALGYAGSQRTTRRIVTVLRSAWRHDNHRVYKPWITEPGAGCSTTSAKAPTSAGARSCCSAPGSPGAASG